MLFWVRKQNVDVFIVTLFSRLLNLEILLKEETYDFIKIIRALKMYIELENKWCLIYIACMYQNSLLVFASA